MARGETGDGDQEDIPLGYGLFLAASLRYAGVFICNRAESTPCALNHANITEHMVIKIKYVACVIIVSISMYPKP